MKVPQHSANKAQERRPLYELFVPLGFQRRSHARVLSSGPTSPYPRSLCRIPFLRRFEASHLFLAIQHMRTTRLRGALEVGAMSLGWWRGPNNYQHYGPLRLLLMAPLAALSYLVRVGGEDIIDMAILMSEWTLDDANFKTQFCQQW